MSYDHTQLRDPLKYIPPDGDFTGFNAPDKGQEIARGMYDSGIDIIYAAAGSSGTGMFKAAKEYTARVGQSKKVWGIGVDSDQAKTVGAGLIRAGAKPTPGERIIALAEKLGISTNALTIRACRIRDKLEGCVGKCVSED